MSFCSDIKCELSKIKPQNCCEMPLAYGFLLFSRYFGAKKICMQTENIITAELYKKLLYNCYGATVTVSEGGGKKKTYRAAVESESDRLKILASVDFGIYGGKINGESFFLECCSASFIRGAFLACGQISDPAAHYRADFSVRDINLANEFKDLLSRHFIEAHISKRQNGYTVYISKSEMIINLLTCMGASQRSLELIETTIMRSVNNNINRALNCDNSNIKKTVETSIKQRRAIDYLIKSGKFESLPADLKAAADLRLNYPESTLKELCELSKEKISVSGLNRRFKKITEIYENLKK